MLVLPLGAVRGIVFDPTIKELAVFRDMNVPEMVIPAAPGVRVILPIVRPVGAAVMVSLPIVIVRAGGVEAGVRGMVWELRMSWLAVLRDSKVPSTVTSGAPAVSVDPPISTFVGFAVMVWLPIAVTNFLPAGFGSGMVLNPTTIAEDTRDIGVPDIVIAGTPGVSVVPAMETPFASC